MTRKLITNYISPTIQMIITRRSTVFQATRIFKGITCEVLNSITNTMYLETNSTKKIII
jgi:hypothetical protein